MPQSPGGDELIRSAFKRAWLQRGGPRPSNPLRYAGADGAYIEVGDLAKPVRSITREQNHDPYNLRAYRTSAVIDAPPDFPTNQVMFKNLRGAIPFLEVGDLCDLNLYVPTGYCRNPGDFSGGWETGVEIYSKGRVTSWSRQGSAKFSEDVAEMIAADLTWTGGSYRIGPLFFQEEGAATVSRQIVDVAYAPAFDCGNCGPGNDGVAWRYALQQDDGASTGVLATVIYTVNDGASYAASTITTLAGNDTVTAMAFMAGYLVVLTDTGLGYHYAPVNEITGAIGAWTAVTGTGNGFVTGALPNDLYVRSPNEAFICADTGYVYRLSQVGQAVTVVSAGTATAQNLQRIDGNSQTIVAVGANGAVVVSDNKGRTWAPATTALGVSDTVQAVAVLSPYYWYVGTDGGDVFVTETAAQSAWVPLLFAGSGAGAVHDIVAATEEVLYISHSTATPDARILASICGGAIFDLSSLANQRRLQNLPTFDVAQRLAVPQVGSVGSIANHLYIGGLAGNGSDGILLHGATGVDFS